MDRDRDSMSATLKLPTFNGSRLRDFKHWGLLVTDVALSARSLRLVANHIGHLFNPSRYPEQAMPAAFTEPAPTYPTGFLIIASVEQFDPTSRPSSDLSFSQIAL